MTSLRRQVVMALKKEVPVIGSGSGCDRGAPPAPLRKAQTKQRLISWLMAHGPCPGRLNSLNVARYAEACTSVVADESSRHDNQAVEWSSFTGEDIWLCCFPCLGSLRLPDIFTRLVLCPHRCVAALPAHHFLGLGCEHRN